MREEGKGCFRPVRRTKQSEWGMCRQNKSTDGEEWKMKPRDQNRLDCEQLFMS